MTKRKKDPMMTEADKKKLAAEALNVMAGLAVMAGLVPPQAAPQPAQREPDLAQVVLAAVAAAGPAGVAPGASAAQLAVGRRRLNRSLLALEAAGRIVVEGHTRGQRCKVAA